MKKSLFSAAMLAALSIGALIVGCGGGGSSSPAPTGTASPVPSPSPSGVIYTGPDTDGPSSDPAVCRNYTPAPTITSMTAHTGSIAGGETIVIRGSGFSKCSPSIPLVIFGDAGPGRVTSYGPDQITVVTPSTSRGTVDVRVSVTNPSFVNPNTSHSITVDSALTDADKFTFE